MTNQERTSSVITGLLLLAFLAVAAWMVIQLGDAATKIGVAIIGVGGVIIGAIVKHSLELEKERRHDAWLAKQENYKDLLSKVGAYARKEAGSFDALTCAHLASWAFGDVEVMLATNSLMKDPSRDVLVSLLKAIRTSLEQPELPATFDTTFDSAVLFAARTEVVPGLTG